MDKEDVTDARADEVLDGRRKETKKSTAGVDIYHAARAGKNDAVADDAKDGGEENDCDKKAGC